MRRITKEEFNDEKPCLPYIAECPSCYDLLIIYRVTKEKKSNCCNSDVTIKNQKLFDEFFNQMYPKEVR